jgi:hypothetical protein
MLKIINEELLNDYELNRFMSGTRGGRKSMYADVLNRLNQNPVGYKVVFQTPAGFKFHAPYTLAETLGFKIAYQTVGRNKIEMVKTKLINQPITSEMASIMDDIFGTKLSEYDTTQRGSLREILNTHLTGIGDKVTVVANSSNTIHKAAKSAGKSVTTKNITKHKQKAPFKFVVTQKRKSA